MTNCLIFCKLSYTKVLSDIELLADILQVVTTFLTILHIKRKYSKK